MIYISSSVGVIQLFNGTFLPYLSVYIGRLYIGFNSLSCPPLQLTSHSEANIHIQFGFAIARQQTNLILVGNGDFSVTTFYWSHLSASYSWMQSQDNLSFNFKKRSTLLTLVFFLLISSKNVLTIWNWPLTCGIMTYFDLRPECVCCYFVDLTSWLVVQFQFCFLLTKYLSSPKS